MTCENSRNGARQHRGRRDRHWNGQTRTWTGQTHRRGTMKRQAVVVADDRTPLIGDARPTGGRAHTDDETLRAGGVRHTAVEQGVRARQTRTVLPWGGGQREVGWTIFGWCRAETSGLARRPPLLRGRKSFVKQDFFFRNQPFAVHNTPPSVEPSLLNGCAFLNICALSPNGDPPRLHSPAVKRPIGPMPVRDPK
jgi:hypothetical protein